MLHIFFVLGLTTADQRAIDSFSPTLRFFYLLTNNPSIANWLLWFTITGLAILVYKLGFAKRLPLLKSAVIYLFLITGCLFLTFLAIFLPIAEGLMVAALILIIYKIRLKREKKAGTI
ncbi:YlaH-like family protein [Lederbergia citrea]|uniref:YlaH-like family protein n=1 Tax=Lederbergia citrea TaxID=2833581 RepID=A0A942Z3L6_9BACI|nr:YlaH-like family protein [Lederbergia citrea]MBS4177262.1 YlaH-like family protein [Lederbergia citrea]MBS4203925.1 YlaH-like family protein [Lederbergia citrea]MBS4221490.1 YlaH-like family protein [Lederbergia citrea]